MISLLHLRNKVQNKKENSIKIKIYGHTCNVISIDDFIKVKSSMNRPKDLQAIEELFQVKKIV